MRANVAVWLVALLLVAGGVRAGITVVATGSVTTGVTAPPVRFEVGDAGASTRYFAPLTLSANATAATGTLVARAGADVYAQDALRLVNARAEAQTVTLSSARLENAQLDLFHVHVYDDAALVATIDLESAAPTALFTLPGSSTYRLDVRLDLADGAGRDTIPPSFTLALSVGTGGLRLVHTPSDPLLDARQVETPLGPLATDSLVGANATNGTGSIAAAILIAASSDVFYLNNTNASGVWYVRLVHVASTGLETLTTGNVGVDNGTRVEHVKTSSGSVTQPSGSYQRLEPGSSNRVYVHTLEDLLFSTGSVDLDIHVSDTEIGASFTVMKARIVLT